LLPLRLDGERTVVVAVLLLLLELLSGVLEVTVAVLLRVEAAGTVGSTATVSVKTELPTANEGFEHETVPLSPGAGVVHDHPLTEGKLTNVVPTGSGPLHEALLAALGPLLVTVIV